MNSEKRRRELMKRLSLSTAPVSASTLAEELSVSRQVIVGDVALLRSAGEEITATPRGYVINRGHSGYLRQIAVRHGSGEMEKELCLIVDNGCTVIDVTVEHPVYGQLTGPLQISNRYEVRQFMERCASAAAHPLSTLTEGIHLHTIACPDEEAFKRVERELRECGILLEEN